MRGACCRKDCVKLRHELWHLCAEHLAEWVGMVRMCIENRCAPTGQVVEEKEPPVKPEDGSGPGQPEAEEKLEHFLRVISKSYKAA